MGSEHLLSPAGVASMLILAFVIDYLSIGPDNWRDKVAFLIALPMLRMGFDGGPLDTWTVGALSGAIDALKAAGGGSYIAGAATHFVVSALVACLAIYAAGALMPDKLSTRLGAFARLSFPTTPQRRVNWKLWAIAALLGMMADLTAGAIGGILDHVLDWLSVGVSWLPGFLFGIS
ncbi:hypothetical protein F4553_005379 [Allocatelliglobosispora scoriae]|uniref:Uncharacterized protein n=1 Tax=Allocatelliglobosispora scoriae TaxID=643052 RepID=A0A841BZ53_9ACTN|nr:hypothetical protein [Allocatelliglobosispora scoriae]MBB5872000.1 hypothetical protein [Allocatelliglobosispora scoriae]